MEHFYALIMAGGGGTRLWPLSRKNSSETNAAPGRGTQHVSDLGGAAAAADSRSIIFMWLPAGNMPRSFMKACRKCPSKTSLSSRYGRNNGPAAGLGTIHIRRRDPEAVIAMLTADHHIADQDKFRSVLRAGCALAAQESYCHAGNFTIVPIHWIRLYQARQIHWPK